jgi:hypothetical protein
MVEKYDSLLQQSYFALPELDFFLESDLDTKQFSVPLLESYLVPTVPGNIGLIRWSCVNFTSAF